MIAKILCWILSLFYAMPCYVTDAEKVTFTDFRTENVWEMNDGQEWNEYDECLLVMFNCGTTEVTDDIIVLAIKEGE